MWLWQPLAPSGATATVIDLTTATLNFDGQSTQNRLLSTLTSALLNFDAAAVQNALRVTLTSALLTFTPQMVTVFAAKLIDLTAASLTFTANAVQTTLVVPLTTASLRFVALAMDITTGFVAALDDAYTRWRRLPRR
jgi:hypothetical protein